MAENPLYKTGFGLLVIACAGASYYFRETTTTEETRKEDAKTNANNLDEGLGELPSPISAARELVNFEKFKRNYLLVYCLVMSKYSIRPKTVLFHSLSSSPFSSL